MTSEIKTANNQNHQLTTRRNLVKQIASEGMVSVQIDSTFFGLMTPNDVRHSSEAALSVGVTDIQQEAVPKGIVQAGHSEIILRGSVTRLVKPEQIPDNMVQKLPDHSLVHITVAKRDRPLEDAQKPAIISSSHEDMGEGNKIRLIATFFSPQAEPDDSVKDWFGPKKELEAA